MSLASDFSTACNDLHHVVNYHKFFPAKQYRFTFGWEDNIPSYKPLFINEMEWDFTTPPAVAKFRLWERRSNPSVTDPVIFVNFVIIDCTPTITFRGTSAWWFGNDLQVSIAGSVGRVARWVHLIDGSDVSGSIGVYKFPFVE